MVRFRGRRAEALEYCRDIVWTNILGSKYMSKQWINGGVIQSLTGCLTLSTSTKYSGRRQFQCVFGQQNAVLMRAMNMGAACVLNPSERCTTSWALLMNLHTRCAMSATRLLNPNAPCTATSQSPYWSCRHTDRQSSVPGRQTSRLRKTP